MSRSRVYAVLASADNATGPLTIHYRTAADGGGEAPVAWTVEPLPGTRTIRVTREEIRRRLTAPPVPVVVPADFVDVESTPTDSRLDGAFQSYKVQDNGVLTTTTPDSRRRIYSPNAWHHVELPPPQPKQTSKAKGGSATRIPAR
jgi:hypothetical protein